MLHILLLILRIIGIFFLVIIGLILFAVISVLVVPLRYSADGSGHYREDDHNFKGHAIISWFLHAVTMRISYEENKLLIKVKLFFFTLYEMTMPEERSSEEDRTLNGYAVNAGEGSRPVQEREAGELRNVQPEENTPAEDEAPKENTTDQKVISSGLRGERTEEAAGPERKEIAGGNSGEGSGKRQEASRKEKNVESLPEEKKPGFFERTSKSIRKAAAGFFEWLSRVLKRLNGILSGEEKIFPEQGNAVTRLINFWKDEANKATVHLVTAQIGKLFKHILPRKCSGNIRAGFEDPSMTGTMLVAIAPFYGLYGRSFAVEPVFDETVLEGDIKLKGHIRLISIILIVLRVFTDRNFRRILNEWRKGGSGNG